MEADTSIDVVTEKGYGFITADGKHFMIRCHDCGGENYGPAVASGVCAWCGFDANKIKPVL